MMTLNMPGLHPRQREVMNDKTRFRVLACGRRWGKTRLGSALCMAVAALGGRAWWVAPTYPVSMVGWRLIRRMAVQIPDTEIRQVDRLITLPNGGEIQVRSADNPDSLRGEGLDFAVMDECAFMLEAAWQEALRPALSDRQGRAMFISTPKGRNWYWRLWQRCQDPEQTEWKGWQLPTSDNPFIPKPEIEAARSSLPERIFQQEYLAEFLDDAGGVFRNVTAAATATPQTSALPGRQYVIGADWGQSNDFTVFAVFDIAERALVHLERFNQIDYELQKNRLRGLVDRFRPVQVLAEANSMGRPIIDSLATHNIPIMPFTTTNATKTAAIQALQLAFETATIRIIPDPVLLNELQSYEMDKTMSGLIRYGAPEGVHDDTVMACAIGWQGVATGDMQVWLV